MPLSRHARSDRGASVIELAVITPVMVLLVMGVLDLARGYKMQIELSNAAREGAAYAQFFPNDVYCTSRDDISERVQDERDGIVVTNAFTVRVFTEDAGGAMTQEVTGCGGTTVQAGDRVKVEVSGIFDVFTPLIEDIAGPVIYVRRSAEVVVQE